MEALLPLLICFVNGATWGIGGGRGSHMPGIPFSGWASSRQTLRMWEMEDERTAFPAYQVTMPEPEKNEGGEGWICTLLESVTGRKRGFWEERV